MATKTIKIYEDKKKFNKWCENFLSEHGGWFPNHNWFEEVQKSHLEIRKKIGGTKRIETIVLNDTQKDLNHDIYKDIYSELDQIFKNKLSNMTEDEGLDRDFLKRPTAHKGSHTAIKTSKIISRWGISLSTKDQIELNKINSNLGKYWSKSKVYNSDLTINLSTEAKAFMMLGYYGPDEDSCFRQGGSNDMQKYILGQTDNTFVVLIKEKKNIVARFWGFLNEETFNLNNFYFNKSVHEGNIIEALTIFFSNLLNKEIFLHENQICIDEGIYHNGYGNFSFSIIKHPTNQLLVPNIESIVEEITCPRCHENYESNEEFGYVDNQCVCYDCIENSSYCSYSNTYTFEEIFDYKTSNGSYDTVKESLLNQFKNCEECEDLCFKDDMTEVRGGVFVCPDCLDQEYKPYKISPYGWKKIN